MDLAPLDFIRPELLILVPVLYFFGMAAKRSARVEDNCIPTLLGLLGMGLASLYVMASMDLSTPQHLLMAIFVGITQGILCAGCSVYFNQLIKQKKK